MSLRGLLNKQESKNKPEQKKTEKKRLKEFTTDELIAAWYSFPNKILEQPKLHYLFKQIPLFDNEKNITIKVPNSIVNSEVKELMPTLHKHLSDTLENDTIVISTELMEQQSALPTSSKEKARYMAEKNHELKKLFKDLKLDFI
ncbi:MAG: hypothetical protein EOL95_02280 [Bacteroidia bacterium]|nr:hypothetical protein [Bacteroidia bacterium]